MRKMGCIMKKKTLALSNWITKTASNYLKIVELLRAEAVLSHNVLFQHRIFYSILFIYLFVSF